MADEDVARLEGGGRARRAARDGEPPRSSAVSRASPSTYRQENVTRWGSRSSGSPTTSTSGTVCATRSRTRATRGRSRASSAAASARAACRPDGRGDDGRQVDGVLAPAGQRAAPAGAGADGEHADRRPGRPRCGRRPTAATSRPARPPRPATAEASTCSGTPRAAAALGDLGHRLAGADLVARGGEARERGVRSRSAAAKPAASTRPTGRPATALAGPRPRRAARTSARRRECTTCGPVGAGRPGALHGPAGRRAAAGREHHLVRARTPRPSASASRAPVEQQPGPPAGAVQLGGVGPAVVERGEQRGPGGRVQRHAGGRVQEHRGGCGRGRVRARATLGHRRGLRPSRNGLHLRWDTLAAPAGDRRASARPAGPVPVEEGPRGCVPPPPRPGAPCAGRVPASRSAPPPLALLTAGCDVRSAYEDSLSLGFPDPVTDQAQRIYDLWLGTAAAGAVVGFFVWGLILFAVFRYRKRSDELPRQVRYNLPVEVLYTVVPFVIIAVLFYYTAISENDVNETTEKPGRHHRRHRLPVELDLQLRRQRPGDRRPVGHRRARPAGAAGPADRPHRPLRRDQQRRHPLVLRAEVPVQARRHPGAQSTSSRSPSASPAPTSAAAPSCAARSTTA